MKFSDIKKVKPPPTEPAAPLSEEGGKAPPPPVKPRLKTGMSYTELFMAKFPALARKAAAAAPSAGPPRAKKAQGFHFSTPSAPSPSPQTAAAAQDAARKAYGRAIAEVKALLRDAPLGRVSAKEGLGRAVLDCLALLEAGNQHLLVLTSHSTASNYLYAHSTNVSILAMNIGLGMGLGKGALGRLGLAAILQDADRAKHLGLAHQASALSPEEYEEVRLHPVESGRLRDFISETEESARRILAEVIAPHLPPPPKTEEPAPAAEESSTSAQIIALCEIYESLCHHRSWREPLLPHAAVKWLIKEQSRDFDRRMISKFVERLSLFPPGSYVELSSGEIACVVGTNPKSPTLPTVELRLRADQTPSPPLLINLAENPLTHIKRAIDETRLPLKDQKTLLAFQAARWWVD